MGFRISTHSSGGSGIFGKLVFSAFGLFFAFMGSMFVKQEWSALQETRAMQQWTQTPCAILSSEMQDAGDDFKLVLSYAYTFDGRSYTATRYGRRDNFTAERIGEINRLQKALTPGTKTQCYVNPNHPNEAVLKLPSVKNSVRVIGFTLIFPAIGLFFATVPWFAVRKKKTRETEPEIKKNARSGKLPLILFGSVFALIGLIAFKPLFITPMQKSNDAKTWSSVPATVISSKVKSHSDDDGTTYSVYIAYRYEIAGEEYIGDQYSFAGGSSSGHAGKAEIVSNYPKDHAFSVFVNPANSDESVIRRELSNHIYLGLIPLIFTVVGVAVIIGGLRSKAPKLDMQQARERAVTLKGPSPRGKAVGISLFATVWSGIVVLLIKSDAPLFFPIIFGLAGIGMICAAIHAILATFNPRPGVELTPGDIHPGTDVSLRWRINGNAARIEKLTGKIQCLKITVESRGSGKNRSTRVVKTPLYENEILTTEKAYEIAQGTATFQIPDDRPASRPGNSSGIQWQVCFHGDISRWPDLKQEFPFIVYPE